METYHGHVRTPADAIVLFEACRLGLLPRVQRRLSEKERQKITSGSVFVWDEREAGMRRWTDGKSWSASRVSGSFLTYREMEGKRGGGSNAFAPPVAAMTTGRGARSPNPDSDSDGMDIEGPDGYRYKPDGLMKQSFSITTAAHQKLHLISYYARSHHAASNLTQPTCDPALKHIRPAKGMYPESTVHEQQNVPVSTRAPMNSHGGGPTYSPRHNVSYGQQPPSHTQPMYSWPPSPVATPPTSMQQVPQFGQQVLPQPTQSAGQHMSYNPHHYPPPQQQTPQSNGGSPRMYDRAALPQVDGRIPQPSAIPGSTGSPLAVQQSPRGASAQVQRSSPPLALPVPNVHPYSNDRYTSPANSSHSRSPSRNDVANPDYNIRPLRNSPKAQEQDTGLSVQDIPCEKLTFREDVRALRVLDRGFAA